MFGPARNGRAATLVMLATPPDENSSGKDISLSRLEVSR